MSDVSRKTTNNLVNKALVTYALTPQHLEQNWLDNDTRLRRNKSKAEMSEFQGLHRVDTLCEWLSREHMGKIHICPSANVGHSELHGVAKWPPRVSHLF